MSNMVSTGREIYEQLVDWYGAPRIGSLEDFLEELHAWLGLPRVDPRQFPDANIEELVDTDSFNEFVDYYMEEK